MPESTYLLSPGPTNIPDRVLKAMQIRSMHHRSDEFSVLLARLGSNLQKIFGTAQTVLPLHATGRGAMEATLVNLLRQGDEIVSVCNGRFGAMYADIAAKFGLKVTRVCENWERDVDLDELRRAFQEHPRARAVTLVQSESSTAVANDVPAIARMAREFDKLVLVDCVSSLGGMPFAFDEWGVDAAVTASQKALMGPTGLSFVVLSEKAWKAVETSDFPKAYLSLAAVLKNLKGKRPETPGSTPVQLVAALAASTDIILEEGVEAVWARHARLAEGVRASLRALGLRLFPDRVQRRSDTLSAAWMPEGVSASRVNRPMQDLFGVVGKAGLLQYTDRVLRLGHMGDFLQKDALILVSALEFGLRKAGLSARMGAGLEALVPYLEAP